ncbi:MAG: DUF1080 domain-containing protein [candidate division KSB1 bacterium]|nr:DUF1080 domain-containing protein [candidate division KSB1 bacterium]
MNIKNISTGSVLMLGVFLILSGCAPEQQTEKHMLWNGKDFSGWTFYLADDSVTAENVWSVTDSSILCKGQPNGYMRTDSAYSNYKLNVEWRWLDEPSNSGVLLHIQAKTRSGRIVSNASAGRKRG